MQLMSEVVGGHREGPESSLLGLKVYACVHAKSFHSCPTLCSLMSCRLPGSSVHGILQARILEWVAMPSSRDRHNPGINPHFWRLLHWQAGSLLVSSRNHPYVSENLRSRELNSPNNPQVSTSRLFPTSYRWEHRLAYIFISACKIVRRQPSLPQLLTYRTMG